MYVLDLRNKENDTVIMYQTFKRILGLKKKIPKDFELKIIYGDPVLDSSDPEKKKMIICEKIWTLSDIKKWVKAEEDSRKEDSMTFEERFANMWKKYIQGKESKDGKETV